MARAKRARPDYKEARAKRVRPDKVRKIRKGSTNDDYLGWWEILMVTRSRPGKLNFKRNIRKGSTDVYVRKRYIEIEID